jgi:hypothetical protein
MSVTWGIDFSPPEELAEAIRKGVKGAGTKIKGGL